MTYIDSIAAEIRQEVASGDLPEGESLLLFRLYALLMLAKGASVSPEDVHNAWCVWMSARDPEHVSLVPFEDLTTDIAAHDIPYAAAIVRVAERHG